MSHLGHLRNAKNPDSELMNGVLPKDMFLHVRIFEITSNINVNVIYVTLKIQIQFDMYFP